MVDKFLLLFESLLGLFDDIDHSKVGRNVFKLVELVQFPVDRAFDEIVGVEGLGCDGTDRVAAGQGKRFVVTGVVGDHADHTFEEIHFRFLLLCVRNFKLIISI